MTQDDSSEILTDNDVIALFTAFPDLIPQFPEGDEDAGKNAIMSFMDKKAKESGVRGGAQQVLEFTAVAIAMKLRAKIALGELKEDDLAIINPDLRDDVKNKGKAVNLWYKIVFGEQKKEDLAGIMPELLINILDKADKFKQGKEPIPVVSKSVCKEIRDMDFQKALSILALQDKISRTFTETMNAAERKEFLQGDASYKFASLSSISGNETASGKSLRKGEFSETIEHRLRVPIESGEEIFKTFASLHLTNNALKGQTSGKLREQYPEDDRETIDFFSLHPAEVIMAHADTRIPDNKAGMEQLKQMVQSLSSPESTFDSNSGILEAYAETNVLKGYSPIDVNRIQRSAGNQNVQGLDISRRETGMPMYASMQERRI